MTRILLCLLFVAMLGSADAQQFARSAVCVPENSKATTIATVVSDPEAWMGKCVSVDGLYLNERVYADLDGIYGLNANFIGGFIDGMQPLAGAWRGSFIGRVSDCAVWEEVLLNGQLRGPGINLHGRTLGCLAPEGPMLMFMTASGLEPSGLRRRVVGAKGGNLLPAPAEWPHRHELDARAEAFAQAMASADASTLGALLDNGYRAELLLSDAKTAFAGMKQSGARDRVLLMQRTTEPDRMAGEACWCLTRDCSKLWPIDARDADNQPGRPYACLRMEGLLIDGAWRYHLDASHDVAGLAEPKR